MTSRSERERDARRRAAGFVPPGVTDAEWDAACVLVWRAISMRHTAGVTERRDVSRTVALRMDALGRALACEPSTCAEWVMAEVPSTRAVPLASVVATVRKRTGCTRAHAYAVIRRLVVARKLEQTYRRPMTLRRR